ncbi:efflux RND transporter periplasmic adaptor subunit [Pseudomonas sp.]|uniref:efflux RND transporter periplasmic adaptor subunit n=1 Tax=Pseudomonas sp. TaxID=306 RepID=UPI0023521071|nr:efflux RND transporter periplasmic adaptor subunit [Pseudomonas sp.]
MRKRFVLAAMGLLVVGQVGAADRVELTTRVSGVVAEVLVKSGQRVDAGRVLLRLDPTILQARLDEAAAEQARAEADAADAARELTRARELYERTVSSTTELDAAVLRDTRAGAALAAARARHAVAKKNLADAELKAPFAGVVQAVPGQPGTVVSADCQPKTLVILGSGRL